MSETDLKVLKNILSDKKTAIESVNSIPVKVFASDVWNYANLIFTYIKKYHEIPTQRILEDFAKTVGSEVLIKNIPTFYEQLDKTETKLSELKYDVEKLKLRASEGEIFSLKNDLVNLKPGDIDVKRILSKFQKTTNSINELYNESLFENKNINDFLGQFVDSFNRKKNNPEEAQGFKTHYSYLDYATNGLKPADFILIAGESGFGKCHAKGQKIIKYDGTLINVEDVQVGDLLMGPDSNSRTVLTTNTGKDYMYDIVPVKGKSFRVNSNHILTCAIVGTDNLIDISIQDYLKLPQSSSAMCKNKLKLRRASIDFNDDKCLFLDPYFLGLLIGDGSMTHSSITITSMDEEIVSYSKLIAEKFNLKLKFVGNKGRGKAGSYLFSGTKGVPNIIAQYLNYYGLRYKNSGNKFIPFDYKTSSRNSRLELLAGIIDTDGHLNKRGTFEIVTKSKQLSEDILFVARSLGLAAYESQVKKRCQNNFEGIYNLVLVSGDIDMIPTKLKRKQAFARKQIKRVLNTGFEVVPTNNIEDYYGFSINQDHRYILDDFTITHNSLMLNNIGVQSWLNGNTIMTEPEHIVEGKNIIYFSLEMPLSECFNRILAKLTGVPCRKIENATLSKDEYSRVKDALSFIKRYPYKFRIVDLVDACANDLDAVIQNSEDKYDAIFCDYLGIMSTNDKSDEADWLKQGTIAYELRRIARTHKVPVFSAVQLNRKSQKESSDNVGLARLARSASIATHATHVIQIESRQKEEAYPDFIYHVIKNRKGAKGKGILNKNLACASLIDIPLLGSEDSGFTDVSDISDQMESLEDL